MAESLHSIDLSALHFVRRTDCVVSFVRCWSAVVLRLYLNFFCAGG